MKLRLPVQPGITRGSLYSLIALFAVVIVLAGASYVLTSHAISRAAQASATVTQLCETGNQFRAQQIQLWAYIITISQPPPHETAAQERARLAALRAFNGYLHRVFAPRNCQRIDTQKGVRP